MEQKYLDSFGKKYIKHNFDSVLEFYVGKLSGESPNPLYRNIADLYLSLSKEQQDVLRNYIEKIIGTLNHDFLSFFEENTDYKIVARKENGDLIDLRKLSEKSSAGMLHGELFTWISEYSKYKTE